jgi:hypothetical protein
VVILLHDRPTTPLTILVVSEAKTILLRTKTIMTGTIIKFIAAEESSLGDGQVECKIRRFGCGGVVGRLVDRLARDRAESTATIGMKSFGKVKSANLLASMHQHGNRGKNLWMDLIQANAVNMKRGDVTRTRQRGRRRKGYNEHAMVVLVIL